MSAPAVPPGGFEVRGAELMAGGRSVTELAGQLGTPLYIYDRRQIAARVRELRAAMPAGSCWPGARSKSCRSTPGPVRVWAGCRRSATSSSR